jgi:hypothetical protein
MIARTRKARKGCTHDPMHKALLYRRVNHVQKHLLSTLLLLSIVCIALLITSCDTSTAATPQSGPSTTFTGSSTQQQITYNTSDNEVLLRTFYGGGQKGTFNLGPQISIYGDGTYILGLNRQGKLDTTTLQQLLNTLVDTDGLLTFKRQLFFDIPDQDATFLDININGKHLELMYGAFGSQPASAQDQNEYQRLGKALTTLSHTLQGATTPYKGKTLALLAYQTFSANLQLTIPDWPIADFTLAQAATFECGIIPEDDVSSNPTIPCLQFTIPAHAILLNTEQIQSIEAALNGKQEGDFYENGQYYTVTLRPLLPDELQKKMLAMFGSSQTQFIGVPLLEGSVPPVPTPTPAK